MRNDWRGKGVPGVKVLHVAAGNLYGGIETFLGTLGRLRHLTPDVERVFAVFHEGRLAEELRQIPQPVHVLGSVRFRKPWSIVAARRRLASLLTDEGIDLVTVHGCWVHCLATPVALAAKVPTVFWGHEIHRGRHWLERWAKRIRPARVVSNGETVAESVRNRLYPDVPLDVVRHPVPKPVPSRPGAGAELRRALDAPADAVVVLIASRLERWKGHLPLVEALSRLRTEVPWRCWIAGGVQRPQERTYRDEIVQALERAGIADRVRLIGHRSDMPDIYDAADTYCQPNLTPEPFGVSFVQALHAGLPVVSTDFGGAKEIVTDECGLLVPPDDIAGLVRALERVIDEPDLRRRLSGRGPCRAELLCSPRRQLERQRDSLRRCLPGGGAAA